MKGGKMENFLIFSLKLQQIHVDGAPFRRFMRILAPKVQFFVHLRVKTADFAGLSFDGTALRQKNFYGIIVKME